MARAFLLASIATMAAAGWLVAGSIDRAAADGVYNPNNIEDTPNIYYPGYTGPCNNGLDDDYDGYTDAADSDCLDPKPPPTNTSVPSPTQPPPPTATQGPPPPPSLGGVARYPGDPSGGSASIITAAAAIAVALSAGTALYAWKRVR
jgi:hypothetical protein